MMTKADPQHRSVALENLATIVWISGICLAARIGGFYLRSFFWIHDYHRWNQVLMHLHRPEKPRSRLALVLHFAAGMVLLGLGSTQLMTSLRKDRPRLHRILGRLYLFSALVTACGGLYFIYDNGTVGGRPMNIASTGYGLSMLLCAEESFRTAAFKKDYAQHKLWSWRLYSLAIAAWIYRIEYALILGYNGNNPWHRLDFTGPIDHVMNWFFYIPNLLVVEFLHRGGQIPTFVLKSLSFLLVIITSIAVLLVWGPGALGQLGPWHEKRFQRMQELGCGIDCYG